MIAVDVLSQTKKSGALVSLSKPGVIKVSGDHEVVVMLSPIVRQLKAQIIDLLSVKSGEAIEITGLVTPTWCRADCPGFELHDINNQGLVSGCVQHVEDHERWTRLDWLTECPKKAKANRWR